MVQIKFVIVQTSSEGGHCASCVGYNPTSCLRHLTIFQNYEAMFPSFSPICIIFGGHQDDTGIPDDAASYSLLRLRDKTYYQLIVSQIPTCHVFTKPHLVMSKEVKHIWVGIFSYVHLSVRLISRISNWLQGEKDAVVHPLFSKEVVK